MQCTSYFEYSLLLHVDWPGFVLLELSSFIFELQTITKLVNFWLIMLLPRHKKRPKLWPLNLFLNTLFVKTLPRSYSSHGSVPKWNCSLFINKTKALPETRPDGSVQTVSSVVVVVHRPAVQLKDQNQVHRNYAKICPWNTRGSFFRFFLPLQPHRCCEHVEPFLELTHTPTQLHADKQRGGFSVGVGSNLGRWARSGRWRCAFLSPPGSRSTFVPLMPAALVEFFGNF